MVSRMAKPLTPPSTGAIAEALSPAARALFQSARTEAARLDLELWAVGGTVRDVVLRRPVVDVDLAVGHDAASLATAVARAHGPEASVTVEERFGTASVDAGGERLDLATLRSERYATPGALPTVSLGATIDADLARRDFNVNAIAVGLSGPRAGQIVDPSDGLDGLSRRRFAVLHERSFEDDATRVWRAARLAAHRDLRPEVRTGELIVEGGRWLATISGDRIWAEFDLVAVRGHANRTLQFLDRWGSLAAVSEGFEFTLPTTRALRRRWRPLPVAQLSAVVFAPLAPRIANAALRRLNAPTESVRAVDDTRALLATSEADGLDGLEVMTGSSEEARTAARWLDPRQSSMQRELRRWERTRPHLHATELLALGVPEGPDIGTLLRCLRRGRYLGRLGSTADARALVRRHLERREGAE